MKNLKFRFYDTEDKMMVDGEYWLLVDGNGQVYEYNLGKLLAQEKEKYIVQQSTGLKDKNGKEVYEGDIVKVDIPNYIHGTIEAEVEFCDGRFGIKVIGNPILNNAVGQFKAFNHNTTGITVIGNIYESLNDKK